MGGKVADSIFFLITCYISAVNARAEKKRVRYRDALFFSYRESCGQWTWHSCCSDFHASLFFQLIRFAINFCVE